MQTICLFGGEKTRQGCEHERELDVIKICRYKEEERENDIGKRRKRK